jgi:pyruvate/2-oxoglutarate dehydrogenase complex dihydrolipoamide dehydrogenase (E3) component
MHWDVLILGAGQTGAPLAARLAEAGRRVLLLERQNLGGTCVNYGCTPTKAMVASARAAHVARTAARLGVNTGELTIDFRAIIARKDRLVQQWRSSVERRLARAGEKLTVAHGHGRFVGHRRVDVEGEIHTADVVVINTGARAAVPPIEGLARIPWLDNARIMELSELPEHLIIVGGGFIGCEFAQMFRRFGSQVTIVEHGQHLLGREDAETSAAIESVFRREDIRVLLGERVASFVTAGDEVRAMLAGGARLDGTHILVATGRTANTDDLGHEAAGIELDSRGYVVVDDEYRTTRDGVYATGDVTGGPQFTHTAWDDHRILFDIIAGISSKRRSGRIVPHVTYTDPQVAGVGLTEREARERGLRYELASFPFGNTARAIETDETAGVIRILVDPATERIMGASIVGAEAGELIHILQVLMLANASARVLVDGQIAHPAFAEGLQSALMRLERFALAKPS